MFDQLGAYGTPEIVHALAALLIPLPGGWKQRARSLASKVLHREEQNELVEPIVRTLCRIRTRTAHEALTESLERATPATRQVIERGMELDRQREVPT